MAPMLQNRAITDKAPIISSEIFILGFHFTKSCPRSASVVQQSDDTGAGSRRSRNCNLVDQTLTAAEETEVGTRIDQLLKHWKRSSPAVSVGHAETLISVLDADT